MNHSPPRSHLPPDYPRIRVVKSFAELVTARLAAGVNALCWERTLAGDFAEVVAGLGHRGEAIATLDEVTLRSLSLSEGGRRAVETLLADQALLRAHGLQPSLDCIHSYPRDENPGPVPIDVYSFHADSATVPADTYLCTYFGAPSEGLRQEDAQRCVDRPEIRAELLAEYGGADDDRFREFLREHCYDLHYDARPGAQPFSFGLGNLWRIAIEYPGSPVPPCVHRAPSTRPGDPPRLLCIS